MAENTRRRTGEFLRELFSILMAAPEGLHASEALKQLASRFTLTPLEAANYESGSRRFEKIVRFATVDCVKAGWLVKDKGIWTITEAGQAAYAELPDPEAFYKRACKLYAEWRAAQPDAEGSAAEVAAAAGAVDDVDHNAKAASVTFEETEEQAWADALGTRPPRVKVQVKRQQQAVSVEGLQSFMAVLGDDDVGLFVCAGGLTKDAEAEARTQEKRRITLSKV